MVQHPETVIAQDLTRSALRQERKLDLLESHGWSDIKRQAQGVIAEIKRRREQAVAMDDAEAQAQVLPYTMDPNALGDINGQLAKIHNAMRAGGFPEGIYGDPELARVAKVFSQTQGLVAEGEQPYRPGYEDAPLPFKALGYLGTEIVGPAVGAALEVPFNMGYGLAKLGHDAFAALTGQDVSESLPTQFIQDDNGNVIHNGGKLPSGMEMIAAGWAVATNQEVEHTMREAGLAEQYASLRRSGVDKVVNNVSNAVGMLSSYTLPGGWAMAGGKALFGKGMEGIAKWAGLSEKSEWAHRLVSTIANVSGAAAGNAMFEAVTYGHHEGYAHAAIEGAISTLPILALGKMGSAIERGVLQRAKMPLAVARAVSGAAEGLGFGLWQLAQAGEEFHGVDSLWAFLQDPSAANWGRYSSVMLENAMAMMVFKTATGVTPGQFALDRMKGQPLEVTAARSKEGVWRSQVAQEAKQIGRELRQRGELEAEMEARGVQVPQEGMLGRRESANLIDRAMGLVQRRTGKGTQELGWVAHRGGDVEVTKGGWGTVKVQGGEGGDWMQAHTHPSPTTFSGQDLLSSVLRKPVGSDPDLLITAEKVYSAKRVGEPKGSVDPESIDRTWNKQVGPIKAADIALRRGLDAEAVWDAWHSRSTGERVEPALRDAARELDRELDRYMMQEGARLGLEIEVHTPAEARDRWENYLAGGEFAPRKPSVTGVSRETLTEIAAEGVSEDRFRQARMEATGRYPERPEVVRERLFEQVSARGEFPAEGRLTEPVAGTRPIHARDVIAEAEVGPITPAVRRGGLGQMKRWAKGYYETRQDLIRMRGSRDLNNLAHEWGHALYEKHRQTLQLSPKAQEQLLEVGKPTSTPGMRRDQKLHEGMAEFMARHLLGDPSLSTKHHELYREVMDYISRPEQVGVLEQLQRLEGSFRQWREQGALEQVRQSWISADEPLSRQQAQKALGRPLAKLTPLRRAQVALQRGWDLFRHAMIDDLTLVRKAQERAFSKAGVDPQVLPITANPVKMLETMRGKTPATLETFLLRRAISFGGTETRGKSLREALSEVKPEELDNFVTYLVARRSLEAKTKGLETQLSREHYLLAVERLGNQKFERAAQELKGWFDNVINYAVDAGALTSTAASAIKSSWSVYVPFFRALEGPRVVRPGRGVAERGSGVQRMTTGEQVEIRDPLEAAIEVAQSIIQKSHQAAAMKAFNTLHLTTKGVGRLVTEVPRDVQATKIDAHELAKALDRLEFEGDAQHIAETFADVLRGLPRDEAMGLITLFSQKAIPSGSKPVVAFVPKYTEAEIERLSSQFGDRVGEQLRQENGKIKWLELDKDVYEALMSIDPATSLNHPITRALAKPTQVVKMGATAYNPAFVLRNVARDTILNTLFTDVKTGRRFVPVVGATMNFMEAALAQARGGGRTFHDIGGSQATFMGSESMSMRLTSRRVIHPSTPGELMRKFKAAAASPEATLRLREFQGIRAEALKRGATELEANLEGLHAGQEISTNFIRAGVIGRAANFWIPYFNAGIQGNRKFMRHVLGYEGAGKQKQAIAQGLANITLPSFMLWLAYKDEDWFQDLPPWRRNNYWTVKVPFSDEIVSIPKPFEAGKVFGNVPEFFLHSVSGEPVELSEVGWDLLLNFVNGFDLVPAVLKPTVEGITNYSFFKGREIVPHWMEEGRLPEDQYTSYTTGLAKWLGKTFGIAPPKIENFISGYTGGMGVKLAQAADQLFGTATPAASPGLDIEDLPFVGSLFSQSPHRQSVFVQRIYDLHRELNQIEGSGKLTTAQAGMRDAVRQAKDMISDIKKAAREGQVNPQQADKMSYEIARRVIDRYREVSR